MTRSAASVSDSSSPTERLIYFDGNSLGRLPLATRDRLHDVVDRGVGRRADPRLGHAGSTWPARAGDVIAGGVLGPRPGEVVVADSTRSTCTSWPPRRWTPAPAGGSS